MGMETAILSRPHHLAIGNYWLRISLFLFPTYPGLQGPDLRKESFSENSLTNYWETDFNRVSSSSSSPALLAFTNATGEGLVGGEGVQLYCASEQRMPERFPVVDRPVVDLKREVVNLPSPRFDSFDRCVLEGLGGSVSGSSYPGGILTAYQCPRTQGSPFSFESFLQESKETSYPSPNGQPNSSCIPTGIRATGNWIPGFFIQ